MCGRYVLSLRPSEVRRRLQEDNMPADDYPDDHNSNVRQSYNFAPGYHGLVYRADVPDSGAKKHKGANESGDGVEEDSNAEADGLATTETKYKLQAMKWGLIPFWTKRSPDYGSMMRTINCRDDSLATSGGMWNTMKQKKRCIVVCEGFFEWQKKNNGKEKIPHFIKRKDGQLLCFAGLWDCVKYEDAEDKLYTYTIITTDSNKQLGWLHDRMPVIFDAGSEAIRTWLDPGRAEWSQELQALLKPFSGELELYPVDQAVGKVGNNSPSFVIPVNSKENKKNIANFFGNQAAKKEEQAQKVKTEELEDPESNAPLPNPGDDPEIMKEKSLKREASDEVETKATSPKKVQKHDHADDAGSKAKSPPLQGASGRKLRSSTTNTSSAKSPAKGDGSKKITSFFGK